MGKNTMVIRGKVGNAYLAGFVDGEGSLGLYTTSPIKRTYKYFYSRVNVGNTDSTIPKFLHKKYGGGLNRERIKGALDVYRWYGTGKILEKFLKDISPYLIQKKERAKRLLEYEANKQNWTWKRKLKLRWWFIKTNGMSGKSHRPQRLSERTFYKCFKQPTERKLYR